MCDFRDYAPHEAENQSLNDFAEKLANEAVEDGALDAFVATCKDKLDVEEENLSDRGEASACSTKHEKRALPLDVKIVDFLLDAFTLKNMVKCLIFLLGFMIASTLWDVIIEVYSRPTIVKPKGPHPFFSNHSSKYLTDLYTGNFHPERFVRQTDLLIVMYYAPWSFHSRHLKHPFEVVALVLRNHKNIRFVAVNCWTTAGECRNTFKIYQFPLIVAYSSNVHTVYQGEHSVDHIYRWVVNVRNPIRLVRSMEELKTVKRQFHTLVVGYFPFRDMVSTPLYRSFAAAGMALHTGTQEDDFTCLAVVTSERMARGIGMRFEGDMLLYILEDFEFQWSYGEKITAQSVIDWVRHKRSSWTPISWIHLNPSLELMTEQSAQILNQSSMLLLVTSLTSVYRTHNEVSLFAELAREYWNCKEDGIQSVGPPEPIHIAQRFVSDDLAWDKTACDEIEENVDEMDKCCRSLLPSVDWNMACASSAKYHWEDEERNITSEQEEEARKRRSHWTEQVLVATKECLSVRNGSLNANDVLSRCCSYYDDINQPVLTTEQKSIARKKLRDRELMLADSCMRGRLYEYMKYPEVNESVNIFNEVEPNVNSSIRGMGCKEHAENDTLKFAVLDSLHYSYFLIKWGLSRTKLPIVIAIDANRELFSVMEGSYSQKRVREFIRDYHSHLVSDYLISEEESETRFHSVVDVEPLHVRLADEQVLERLTQRTFHDLIENSHNTSHDVVVFFSGGVWHAPSMTAMHFYHDTANYFSSSSELIKFYMIDTTKNELPYNFNFDRIPAVVIFLANQTDISWKYPPALPFSQPNLLSFVLSHCSARLRWKMALSNCGRVCVVYNRRRLRRRKEKLLQAIHRIRESPHRVQHEAKLQYFVKQLRVVRRVLRALYVALHQSEVLAEESVNSLLSTSVFEDYIRE